MWDNNIIKYYYKISNAADIFELTMHKKICKMRKS